MSHMFISYKREDANKRDSLVTALKAADIPYWYDSGIEGGEVWVETINQNLEQSFAIAVILTDGSLESHYVTYEWAWGRGHGIDIIPLQFENISTKFTGHPLLQIQSMDCRKGITRGVVKKLKYLQKESPFARHLKAHVSNLIMPFRMFSCFSLWIYPFVASQKVSFDIFLVLIQKALAETENLYYEKLPELWLSSSHAFTGKQKKHYELLHEQIYSFQVALRDVEIALDRYRFLVISKIQMTNLEKFRNNTLESLLFSYAIDNEPYDLRYTAFDSLLDEISVILSEENPTYRYKLGYAEMAKSALMRYLSNSDAMLIWDVIKNIVGYEPTSYE